MIGEKNSRIPELTMLVALALNNYNTFKVKEHQLVSAQAHFEVRRVVFPPRMSVD